jgi:hypothetical protein
MQISHSNWVLFDEIEKELAFEYYKLIAKTAAHHHILILIDSPGGDPLICAGLCQTIERKYEGSMKLWKHGLWVGLIVRRLTFCCVGT